MLVIYIVTVLVLLGSDIVSLKVYAGSSASSDSKDSSDSKENDENYYRKAAPKQEAIENKIKYLKEKNKSLPACACGTSGTICKIDIFNANSGITTTLLTCSGCTGPQVPVTSSKECKNVPDVFHPDLEEFCQIVHPRCKNITVYRCSCLAVSTTEALTRTPRTTTTSTVTEVTAKSSYMPGQTTVAVPLPTTQAGPDVTTRPITPFRAYTDAGY